MLRWLRARWQAMVQRAYEKEIEQLITEGQRLKAEWRAAHGDKPFRITVSDRRRLDELAKNLPPGWVKRHTLFADAEVIEDDELE
jgi:hypothetical protein